MAQHDHLLSQHYVLAGESGDQADRLCRRCHDHLLALCGECWRHWEQLGETQEEVRRRLRKAPPAGVPPAPVPDIDLPATPRFLAKLDRQIDGYRRLRRRAQEEFWELMQLPDRQRREKILGARRRFKSRLLADLLLDECRSQVRSDPAEARAIAELVPLVLRWIHEDHEDGTPRTAPPAWAPPLLQLAAALRANALRVEGDLPAAEQAFAELRLAQAREPGADAATVAEITSLEASLKIDQRHCAEAGDLLAQAALAYAAAGDGEGVARVRIQQANLLQTSGRPAAVVPLMEDAAGQLGHGEACVNPYLLQCTVTARVNALCDLDRHAEAGALLQDHLDTYEASADPYPAVLFRGLRGRVSLGLERYGEAEADLADCQDGMLELGRGFDAALAALQLAEVLLAQGRTGELGRLATGLVPRFRKHGVEGEALAAMGHLAKAIAAEAVSRELLRRLRARLTSLPAR